MLMQDAFLRPTPSIAAQAILNDHLLRHIFELTLDLSVPVFAYADFEALMPHFDDLADNLSYFSSFAGSSLLHDFGRLIPCTNFIRLHNLLAELPTNTSYRQLAENFYATVTCIVTIQGNNVNITPGHYFGTTLTNAVPNHRRYRNWLNMQIDQLITANAIRVVNAMATVTRLPLDTPALVNAANYNPYTYLIGYDGNNAQSLLNMLRSMNDFVKMLYPSARPLRSFTQIGTNEIVRHLTLESVLPTWHTLGTPDHATIVANNLFAPGTSPRTPAQFATEIAYLVATNIAVPAAPVPFDAAIGHAATPPVATDFRLEIVTATAAPPGHNTDLIRLFDATKHVQPQFMIFDPSSSSRAHLAAVITSGKLIETHDLSMIGIPLPSPARPLGLQNSQYVLGAIMMRYIRDSTTNTRFIARRRHFHQVQRLAQLFVRSLANAVIVPIFQAGPVTPVTAHAGQGVLGLPSVLPGTTLSSHLDHALNGINVFSSPIGSTDSTVPDQFHPLWSSYRFYDQESQSWYMLPTLRHIYGTRARYSGTLHPSLRIV
jgi:hypothetical protein